MKKIAIVVPTNRPEMIDGFIAAWGGAIKRHHASLYIVLDGDEPKIQITRDRQNTFVADVPSEVRHLVCTGSDVVRNAGIYQAVKDGAEIIITLDDDVLPCGETIKDHIETLAKRVPISWFNPCNNFMRGFPYTVMTEAPVKLSHGCWWGVPDVDAKTQIAGYKQESFPYRGPIPRGCLTPISGMNIAFTRDVAHLVYFAPMGEKYGYHRFGDIWMGEVLKRRFDVLDYAVYHGGSFVHHNRASDPQKNLELEKPGAEANEQKLLPQKYADIYDKMRGQWADLIKSL